MERLGTRLCIGLDPRPEWHPAGVDLWDHCRDVLEACERYACAVKPQVAFFEAQGLRGLEALFRVLELARQIEIPVIIDAKRGDIGSTAEAYAAAWMRGANAGAALTVNPYLGRDTVQPFVDAAKEEGGAIFCLVKTSNPGAGDLQDLSTDRGTVSEVVSSWTTDWNEVGKGYGPVGAVVGATRPVELHRFRQLLPRSLLLLPGVGAQGGKPADLAPAFHPGGRGAIVSASRSVEYASRGSDFAIAARGSAKELREAINTACEVVTPR
ncbi:Orotidine 5'-phosphate decarboxylase [Vulgatibacter incomptus]|uniref:Orotidine 5'-phosphate decarboxylase n=2 Tax=Vulgatibacter incomptus TaxID=1391653 RepID=A0A0K1PHF8_9BACT|nr:Orotidine 5'-phosphate decarboxylase [Vulgatibacter incomptus]